MILAMIESGLNPKAYSRANASGMWQFIYSTGKSYGLVISGLARTEQISGLPLIEVNFQESNWFPLDILYIFY